jgi:MFS family permease
VNSETRSQEKFLLPVLAVNFIATLGFSIVLPFLVFLVVRFGGNALVYGAVGAVYPAMQMIGAPILGRWSDRFGRRRILLLSQIGTLASWVLFAGALLFPMVELATVHNRLLGDFRVTLPLLAILLARAVDGLTGGNVSVANAYVADISSDDDRSRNFGRMGVSSNLGFIVGPALASLLGATGHGETLPALAAVAISAVGAVLIAFHLPESTPCVLPPSREGATVRKVFGHEQRSCYQEQDSAGVTFGRIRRTAGIPRMLWLYFVIFLAFNLFYTAFPIRAANDLSWSVTDTGIFFTVLSAMMVVVQGPVLSWLSDRFSDISLIVVGNLVLGVNFLLMYSSDTTTIYLAALLFAVGNGIMWPSVLALLAKLAGQEIQGAVQGVAGSLGSLASIVGLIGGGVGYQAFGPWTFVAAASLIFMAVVIALPFTARKPAERTVPETSSRANPGRGPDRRRR